MNVVQHVHSGSQVLINGEVLIQPVHMPCSQHLGDMALKRGRLREAVDRYFASPAATDGKSLHGKRAGRGLEAIPGWSLLQAAA